MLTTAKVKCPPMAPGIITETRRDNYPTLHTPVHGSRMAITKEPEIGNGSVQSSKCQVRNTVEPSLEQMYPTPQHAQRYVPTVK